MGDEAARDPGTTPASRLRWYSDRAQIIRDIQAKADADHHDALEIDNKRLRESVEALDRTRQKLENDLRNKDRELAEARTETEAMAAKLKEMTAEHAKALEELTNNMCASERNAKGLLALAKCVCLQMKQQSEGQRIQYAARLMYSSQQAFNEALRLRELVKNPEAHREHHAARYRNLPRDRGVEPRLNPAEFAHLMANEEKAIERSMQEDQRRMAIEFSKSIPDEVMNQAFELLSVTREQVVKHLDTEPKSVKA
jgi:myosin heavy subunit